MATPAPTTNSQVRTIRVQGITGPIRVMNTVMPSVVTFRLLECTVDGKKSDGKELSTQEAQQIKWIVREARSTTGRSPRLEPGRELAKGTGKEFSYTLNFPAESIVATAYVNTPSDKIAHWVKVSSTLAFQPSSGTHPSMTTYPKITDREKLEEPFKSSWIAFSDALKAAGADTEITSTLRSRERAYMMHYSGLVGRGELKPWLVPDRVLIRGQWTSLVNVEWTHLDSTGRVDEAASRRGAAAMMKIFEIQFPPHSILITPVARRLMFS